MVLRHLLAILILPTTVAVVFPFVLLDVRWTVPFSAGDALLVAIGGLFAACGLFLLGATVRRFATEGRGTLAPWDPTQRLVVSGVYRYVRNPMISGVLAIVLGEAGIFRSAEILAWAAVFFLLNAVYLPAVEEPGLVRRFGEAYDDYRRNVPRWIPRFTPWSQ